MPAEQDKRLFHRVAYGQILDESLTATRNPGLQVASNVVYRPFGSIGKRCGTSSYGNGYHVVSTAPVISGTRWYRGAPTVLKQMIVQSGNMLFVGNDSNGTWTPIGSLSNGSQPAFYATSYDPAESNVAGTPASDILIICYGTGAPMKYDGNVLSMLSPTITNQFLGCVNWHEHVWFWGDVNNPDTVYATDLGNPEGFVFTLSQTPPGYQIGRGDGDATVQVCVPLGGVMAVFKTRSISVISGFDFTQGEYQFSVSPWVTGKGTPSPHSVAVMNNTLFWWDGQDFNRMSAYDSQPTPIGRPIIKTAAIAAQNSQTVIKAVAGNFLVQTLDGYRSYSNVYLCAIDSGKGIADTILLYDDDASQQAGKPAWTILTGLNIGSFIPWGGPGDLQVLYLGDALTGDVRLFGGAATSDSASGVGGQAGISPITVNIETGQIDCGTPDQIKKLRVVYLEAEANTATFSLQILSDQNLGPTTSQSTTAQGRGAILGHSTLGVDTILGPQAGKQYQSSVARVNPSLYGQNYTFAVNESSAVSSYEFIGLTLDYIEESFRK